MDVEAFEAYLASVGDVGFMLVNDGSSDNTLSLLRKLELGWSGRVLVIDQQPNQGKAEAVRVGMLRALEQCPVYLGYFDADLATPLEGIQDFARILDSNPQAELVLGARVALLGHAIERKLYRHYLGRVFATAASLVLAVPVYDTQCGAKLFRATPSLRALFEKPFGSRWIFDVEIIARFLTGTGRVSGLFELPLVRWTDIGASRVKATDFIRAIGEMAGIYRHYFLRRDRRRALRILTSPLVRYVGSGGVGTALHYFTLAVAVEIFSVAPVVGTILGALVGASCNYLLNYHLTFASKIPHQRTLPRFVLITALGTALNAAGMWFLTGELKLHYLVAQVACTAIVLLTGFVLNAAWTFSERANAPRLGGRDTRVSRRSSPDSNAD